MNSFDFIYHLFYTFYTFLFVIMCLRLKWLNNIKIKVYIITQKQWLMRQSMAKRVVNSGINAWIAFASSESGPEVHQTSFAFIQQIS